MRRRKDRRLKTVGVHRREKSSRSHSIRGLPTTYVTHVHEYTKNHSRMFWCTTWKPNRWGSRRPPATGTTSIPILPRPNPPWTGVTNPTVSSRKTSLYLYTFPCPTEKTHEDEEDNPRRRGIPHTHVCTHTNTLTLIIRSEKVNVCTTFCSNMTKFDLFLLPPTILTC